MSNASNRLETVLGATFTNGNSVEILRNGKEIFPAMLQAISMSKESIDFVTFVYWQGDIAIQFANALGERAAAGVKVRVLLDAFGSYPMRSELIELMESQGVVVKHFRPIAHWKIWKLDNRTHRKILVCDSKVSFTGGVGIAKEWEGDARNSGEWRDTHFRITGPAVQVIHSAFISNWSEADSSCNLKAPAYPKAAPAGDVRILTLASPSSINWSSIALLFRTLIDNAEDNICIATAYFVADDILTNILCKAARRGVSIQILIPGDNSDSRFSQLGGRTNFVALLEAGIKIFRYQPTMMHAKIMLVDNHLGAVGSANMNHRSMSKDEEICLVLDNKETIEILRSQYEEDLNKSELLDLKHWKERSIWIRIKESVAYLFRHEL
ncbi:MAG: phospholipase D-like domain-containing protein [Porticoccaceae bacterium]|nr:phospholipase D-like domain-containing protein [Porticoccaceae bacterium]